MRVPVKLLGFGFWLLSLNFAQCKEITCDDPRDQLVSRPYYWRTMKLGEKQSYSCDYGYRGTEAEATCTRDGWTPKPLCTEILCDGPKIKNAEIVGRQRPNYRINSKEEYRCLSGFKPEKPVQITCDSQGQWKDIQQCIEITCELKSTTIGVKKINPDGKIIFRAGESVEITCSEKHWIFFTKESRKTFTCKADGKWDNEPVCAEITCDDPSDQLVSRPYYWRTMKLGEKQSYTCVNGYRGTEAEATCTRDGWTPKPLCTEILCDVPKIKNAEIVGRQRPNYRINSKEEYRCLSGFKPEKPVQITCDSQGQWKDIQQCIEITCELKSTTIGVKKINPDGKIIFRARESVEMTCSEKHWFFFTKETRKTFTCKADGKWDNEPVCAEITCDDPRDRLVSKPYYWGTMKLGEKQSYTCVNGYRGTEAEATCTRDGWTPKPLCTEILCDVPKIKNAEIVGRQRPNYRINSKEEYRCLSGFKPEKPVQITCDSQGQWKDIQQCIGILV